MTAVLVVGGGVAGLAAALGAVAAGAEVTVVARGPGATALYSGGMEIAPELDESLKAEPFHPLRRLQLDCAALERALEEACAAVAAALAAAGEEFRGSWRDSSRYLDALGLVRPAQLVARSAAAGELSRLSGRRVGVLELEDLSDYDALAVQEALAAEGVEAATWRGDAGRLPPGPALADLVGRAAPVPEDDRFDLLAYPPGFQDLPGHGFELLAAPGSAHGWRLQQAIGRALAAIAGVERGEVARLDAEGGRLRAAEVGGRRLGFDACVLATGRYIGGGLSGGTPPRERLLGLQLFHQGEPLGEARPRLRHLQSLSPDPGFALGLLTDARLRPLDLEGRPAFANLHAAGAVLAGCDRAAGFEFGVPILTGWLGGRFAAS